MKVSAVMQKYESLSLVDSKAELSEAYHTYLKKITEVGHDNSLEYAEIEKLMQELQTQISEIFPRVVEQPLFVKKIIPHRISKYKKKLTQQC